MQIFGLTIEQLKAMVTIYLQSVPVETEQTGLDSLGRFTPCCKLFHE